jgi:hypothetical protein
MIFFCVQKGLDLARVIGTGLRRRIDRYNCKKGIVLDVKIKTKNFSFGFSSSNFYVNNILILPLLLIHISTISAFAWQNLNFFLTRHDF